MLNAYVMEPPVLEVELFLALLKTFQKRLTNPTSFVPAYNRHIERDIMFYSGVLGTSEDIANKLDK